MFFQLPEDFIFLCVFDALTSQIFVSRQNLLKHFWLISFIALRILMIDIFRAHSFLQTYDIFPKFIISQIPCFTLNKMQKFFHF